MHAVSTDPAGNVFAAGSFKGAIDFGTGPLMSAGGQDIFLTKFDGLGKVAWSRGYGETGDDFATVVATTASSIVLAGTFNGTVDFGNGILSAGDIFLARFDTGQAGVPIWSRSYGASTKDLITAIAIDSDENLVVTGTFNGSIDFGCGTLFTQGEDDIFLARISASGDCLSSRSFGADGEQAAWGLAVDQKGRTILTGRYANTLDFGDATLPLHCLDDKDMFVAVFDSTHKALWSRSYGGIGYQTGWGVTTTKDDDIVLTGSFTGGIDFSEGATPLLGEITAGSGFVAWLDKDGAHKWSRSLVSQSGAVGESVAVDGADNVWATGIFNHGRLDLGSMVLSNQQTYNSYDTFLVKYDSNGTIKWAKSYATRIADDIHADIYQQLAPLGSVLAGVYMYDVDFGCGTLKSWRDADLFIVKLTH